jgi:GntR family transcriptional regulator
MIDAPATAAEPPEGTPSFSPLYQQIKGLIVRSLQGGEWRPGEAIPSEIELAARYKVSQGTVRKAIDELSAENLLVRRQGKGTFVDTSALQRSVAVDLREVLSQGMGSYIEANSTSSNSCRR